MTDSLEHRLRVDLARRAAAFTPHSPERLGGLSSVSTSSVRTRRRAKIIGGSVVIGVLAVGAVPAAAAAGLAPGIANAFGWTHQASTGLPLIPANDATGRLMLTEQPSQGFPGIQVYAASTVASGGTCYTAVSQLAGQVMRAQECSVSPIKIKTLEDGGGGGSATGWLELIDAPGAAYITVGNRAAHIPVADGITAIWLGPTQINVPVNVGSYDYDGRHLQSMTIDEPVGLPKVNWTGPGSGPGGGPGGLHGVPVPSDLGG